MKNLTQMLKQAQEMQSKVAEMQQHLEAVEVVGVAGGGMLEARMNGKGALLGLKIDPALVDPNEVEVLEDLVMAAVNDAKAKAEALAREEMQKLTGGLDLPPGMSLPF
ncbi:YbaB/EbfC family nucleoid-associated protein [Limibacillus halophilus]|jgi:DNA-binding YbaB/EbfC family protein